MLFCSGGVPTTNQVYEQRIFQDVAMRLLPIARQCSSLAGEKALTLGPKASNLMSLKNTPCQLPPFFFPRPEAILQLHAKRVNPQDTDTSCRRTARAHQRGSCGGGRCEADPSTPIKIYDTMTQYDTIGCNRDQNTAVAHHTED